MNLTVNGEPRRFDTGEWTVRKVLGELEVPDPDMVSVQLNGDILERDVFEVREVNDGDELEFLYFMGGGAAL